MKKIILALFLAGAFVAFAEKGKPRKAEMTAEDSVAAMMAVVNAQMDSIEKSFTYQTGTIQLKGGIGTLQVPAGFKYLDAAQAERVLTDLWGNPKGNSLTLGLLLPDSTGVLNDNSYAFNIEYDEIGYVKDDDADDINYEELLAEMQKETNEVNAERTRMGYPAISLLGWASAPYYDKERKILHWAKEVKFGDAEVNTLNYNVRILGRKGVLVLNAIASMPQLDMVKKDLPRVMDIVKFSDGNQYKDFNPDIDNVAAWTIGGLVAGKVLAKVGFFALILKFWKIIAVAVAGFGGFLWKKIRGRSGNDDSVAPTNNA
jgi:uncharacterized membrane-anchored protein